MTSFLAILPILLLALFCAIASFFSLRSVDRLLAETSSPLQTNPTKTGPDSQIHLPR